jgi:hypothetical protein
MESEGAYKHQPEAHHDRIAGAPGWYPFMLAG